EEAAEVAPVLGEVVAHLGAGLAQPAPQRRDVAAEAREVLGDRERPVGRDEEPVRLARLALREPEHLRERDLLVEPAVGEPAEHHGVRAALAQPHVARRAGRLVALGLVVARDVRPERPLARPGAGGLVVGDAVRRHEQRRHGVDDRRLARADVPREERVAPVEVERPHALVERAPVEHLEPFEPEAGPGVVVRRRVVQLDRAEQALHHATVLVVVPVVAPVVADAPRAPRGPPSAASSRYCASRASRSASHWASTNALRMRRTSYRRTSPPAGSSAAAPSGAASGSGRPAGRRNPSSTTRRTSPSTRSTSRASFAAAPASWERKTRSRSTISARVSTRRVSPPSESACASRLRSSARSRLTSNGSSRRGTSRGTRSSRSCSGCERRYA